MPIDGRTFAARDRLFILDVPNVMERLEHDS